MSYTIIFYDKEKPSITISDQRGELLKQALIGGTSWIDIDNDLHAAASISSVIASKADIQYKTAAQLGMPDLGSSDGLGGNLL